jgi:hypothetical protein
MDEEISYGNPWDVTYTSVPIGYLDHKRLLHNLMSSAQASLANEHSVFFHRQKMKIECTHWSDRCLCTVDTVSRTFDRRGSVASREVGPTLPDRTTSHLFALKERNECKTLNHSV